MRYLQSYAAVLVILALALAFAGVQVMAAVQSTQRVERIARELADIQTAQLPDERARQELINLRVQNELRAFLWNSLLAAIGPIVTAVVALTGMLLGLRNYLDAREKERRDRAADDLKGLLEYVVSKEPRERAVGVVGLQHFLTPDKKEDHLRALSALMTAARLEGVDWGPDATDRADPEVKRAISLALEMAVKRLPPALLGQISWQGAKLPGANLAGHTLAGLDLRDADLEDADLSGCDLTGARLTNARLKGAKLDRASLRGADLAYADFAGASLVGANLQGAILHHAKVWRMDLNGADLRGAQFFPERISWHLVRNWRAATFSNGLQQQLVDRYGPAPQGRRVLMLMWEVPPLVAGGSWTAAYHLVRALRQRGANLNVVVPWPEAIIDPGPFGAEVDVIPLGITPPPVTSPYTPSWAQPAPWSPYAATWAQPAPGPGWAPWSSYAPAGYRPPGPGYQASPAWWSPYGYASAGVPGAPGYAGQGFYGPYASSGWYSPYGGYFAGQAPASVPTDGRVGVRARSSILPLADEFTRRLVSFVQGEDGADVAIIHAHDWVTFRAARAAARQLNVPWVAHLHSTEPERRPRDQRDPIIERIEREGVQAADHVVVPSKATRQRLVEHYQVPEEKISVLPNPLSRDEIPAAEMGSFESRRVVFLGRLTWQKGPELFAQVAARVRRRRPDVEFAVYGAGEEAGALQSYLYNRDIVLRGFLDWAERASAFSGATAVLVPSRAEPFGMVVLEAMQHGVPVLYPANSGAAEVLARGIKIDPEKIPATAAHLERLLDSLHQWEELVEQQSAEIAAYPDRGYEQQLLQVWTALQPAKPAVAPDRAAPRPRPLTR